MLEQVEDGHRAEDLKMNVLQAIRFIVQAWDDVTAETISNCWRHTAILPDYTNANPRNLSEDINPTVDLVRDDIAKALQTLHFSDPMNINEFLTIPEEDIIYELPNNDQMITELVNMFKKTDVEEGIDNLDEVDDSTEPAIISVNVAIKSLETVRMFLLQQEDASKYIKLESQIEKFIRKKQISLAHQITLDQYLA